MYSKDSYRELLVQALEQGYQFISFFDEPPADGKSIYLRHDVDASLNMALELAAINQSLGIRATFFVLLRCQVYNLLSYSGLEIIRAIHDSGQDLGFHYAMPPTPLKPDTVAAHVWNDFEIAQRELPEMLPIFAWHNTTPDILDWGLKNDVPGLLSTYSSRFFKDIPYYSDSLARYTPDQFKEILRRDHPVMHLLFHPEIWIGGGNNLRDISAQVWAYVIRERENDPMGINPALARLVPNRMPDHVLEDLKNAILRGDDV